MTAHGPDPGVVLFVFVGTAPTRQTVPSAEGELCWYTIGSWPEEELVEDLPQLLPRILGAEDRGLVYAHYRLDPATQRMIYRWD